MSWFATMKDKIRQAKQKTQAWVDEKVLDFIMNHINLQEAILLTIGKAAHDKRFLTMFVLAIGYHTSRFETWVAGWFVSRKNKHAKA